VTGTVAMLNTSIPSAVGLRPPAVRAGEVTADVFPTPAAPVHPPADHPVPGEVLQGIQDVQADCVLEVVSGNAAVLEVDDAIDSQAAPMTCATAA
jgi:hypothetical protein